MCHRRSLLPDTTTTSPPLPLQLLQLSFSSSSSSSIIIFSDVFISDSLHQADHHFNPLSSQIDNPRDYHHRELLEDHHPLSHPHHHHHVALPSLFSDELQQWRRRRGRWRRLYNHQKMSRLWRHCPRWVHFLFVKTFFCDLANIVFWVFSKKQKYWNRLPISSFRWKLFSWIFLSFFFLFLSSHLWSLGGVGSAFFRYRLG